MKRGRSTGKPIKAEEARIVAAKEGPCLACMIWHAKRGGRCDGEGCDYNHTKSGNIRRGHMAGYALCAWHHRAVPIHGYSPVAMVANFGPTMMHGSRQFHSIYGSDDKLIELQTVLIDCGITPAKEMVRNRFDDEEAEAMRFMEFGDEV